MYKIFNLKPQPVEISNGVSIAPDANATVEIITERERKLEAAGIVSIREVEIAENPPTEKGQENPTTTKRSK